MKQTKEERNKKHKEYQSLPEQKIKRIAYDKKRQSTAEYKEKQMIRRNTPEYKEKAKIASRKFRSTEEFKANSRKYKSSPKYQEWRRNHDLKKKFNITTDEYEVMLIKQNRVCAICYLPETFTLKGVIHSLAVDHDHITGEIRGLLCRNCNQMLGLAKDNVQTLLEATKYLNKKNV